MVRAYMDPARQLLDKLMGPDRDLSRNETNRSKRSPHDPSCCKYMLGGLCPYQLFRNTKSDLGLCPFESHDELLLEAYNNLPEEDKRQPTYERLLLGKLQDLIREMDRKIAKNKQRADEENQPKTISNDQQRQVTDRGGRSTALVSPSDPDSRGCAAGRDVPACEGAPGPVSAAGRGGRGRQGHGGKKAGAAGSAAPVAGPDPLSLSALQAAAEADRIRAEREALEIKFKYPGGRVMYVCEVCGVFINSTDNEARK